MMNECVASRTLEHCTCTYLSCDKRGHCCKCVAYHNRKGEIPGCFFSTEAERTYDRSFARLARDRSEN
jgi:hypothetical protein